MITRTQETMRALLTPASAAYGMAVRMRNRRYDRGRGVHAIDHPVISVGNISVGGTGKSPMVAWIAEQLLAAGHRPAIAMRGYAARPGEPSDEQAEYEDRVPDVPVVVGADRYESLCAFLPNHREIDVVVLDDGFQHRQLHRDLDLVLIDASRQTMTDVLLPAGRLREPLENLARADAVIVTRAASGIDCALEQAIEHQHGRPPIAWSEHHWTGVRVIDAGGETRADVTTLDGMRIVTLLGVGHPASIEAQLERHGAQIYASVPAADHERYSRAKLTTLRGFAGGAGSLSGCAHSDGGGESSGGGADATVMTHKDWVKVRQLIDLNDWPTPIIVPELHLRFVAGEAELRDRVVQAAQQFVGVDDAAGSDQPREVR